MHPNNTHPKSSISRILTLTKYHNISLWNWKTAYLSRFIEAPAYLLFLGGGFNALIHNGAFNYLQFLLTGLVTLIAFRSFVTAIADIANDRKWGILALFMHSGGKYWEYLTSLYLYTSILIITQSLSIIILAKIIFPQIIQTQPAIISLIKTLVLFPGWLSLSAIIGAKVQSYTTRDFIISLISLPTMLTAPIFYPLQHIPPYLTITVILLLINLFGSEELPRLLR